MRRVALPTYILAALVVAVLVVGTGDLKELGEEPNSTEPWEVVFTVDGSWALAIETYNGKLYVGERDLGHHAQIYESSDGLNFTKVFDTGSDQVFVMGVNTLNDTLYIGTLLRIGQDIGRLYYYNGTEFGLVPEPVWWNSSFRPTPTPLCMQMYNNKFFVGGLAWSVSESGNKMWVKYQDQDSKWYWTDMDQSRLNSIIEAYSMEEYNGRLYVGTFEPAKVVVFDNSSDMWNMSLSGWVDGMAVGNAGVIELMNYSNRLHALTWKQGYHWQYDGLDWNGANVSQVGGFGRAVIHNGLMYAGTTPDYGGIKSWDASNFSVYNGADWANVAGIDTIHPQYFTEFQGYVYATAGDRVYRRNITTLPPVTHPPEDVHARLEGPGLEDVRITWTLSEQDYISTNYSIHYYNAYSEDGQGYYFLGSVPAGSTHYDHVNAGHGNPNDYFYYVQANGNNSSAKSLDQAGKFVRSLSAGQQLVSIPLLQQDSSVSSVFATIDYDKVWTYDRSTEDDEWKSYIEGKYYSDLKSINTGMGYWVNVTSSGPLTVAGRVPNSVVIRLEDGWNLVSLPRFESYNVSRAMAETGAMRVEGYEAMNGPYYLRVMTGSSDLRAGEAYWINVPVAVDWVLS